MTAEVETPGDGSGTKGVSNVESDWELCECAQVHGTGGREEAGLEQQLVYM